LPPVIALSAEEAMARVQDADRPFIVRGLVQDWPLVQAGLASPRAARAHLVDHARPVDLPVSVAEPAVGGRLAYDEAMAINFRMGEGRLADIMAGFDAAEAHDPALVPTVYLGSIDMAQFFDGLTAANPAPLGREAALASIWIGNATKIAAHNDFPRNLACCAVGRRRFTLFPPDQFANLYLGPIDITPAGRPIALPDLERPDFERYPRLRETLASASVADLAPGDALFIPSLWYHQVEALDRFNVLVNYWWRDTPRYLGQPQTALTHAIMAIRDLPENERATWRAMFEHYVFSGGADARAHVPEAGQGILAPIDAASAARLHQFLLRSLTQ
jgi:hypothetical protein